MNTLDTTVRNAMVDAACLLLDEGVGEPVMEIRDAAHAVLLQIGLNATRAVAAAVAGVGTFNEPTTGGGAWATFNQEATGTGTASYAVCVDGDGTDMFRMTVGTGSAEVNFSTLSFVTGILIETDTAPTITQPAS